MNNPDTPAGSNEAAPTNAPPAGRREHDPATQQMPPVREDAPAPTASAPQPALESAGRGGTPAEGGPPASTRTPYGAGARGASRPAPTPAPAGELWTPDGAQPARENPPAAAASTPAAGQGRGAARPAAAKPTPAPQPAPAARPTARPAAASTQTHAPVGSASPAPAPAGPAGGAGGAPAATAMMAAVAPPVFPDDERDRPAQPSGRSARLRAQTARLAAGMAETASNARKARLRVARLDPWTVMKVTFLLSIALGIVTLVAVTILWLALDVAGVFSQVGDTLNSVTGTGGTSSGGFNLQSFLSLPNVLGFTTVVAIVDVVLVTALATLGAYLYNLSAGFAGGIEVTLAEDDS